MMKIIMIITLLASNCFSANLKAVEFLDQFDVKTNLDESTQWLLFSDDKAVSEKINNVLAELNMTDLKSQKGMYVADISKMPALISAMFAIPAMKKYAYKVALDKEGALTSAWPKEKAKASMLVLKKLEIVSVEYADRAEAIKKFIQDQGRAWK